MDEDLWRRGKDLFFTCLDLPVEERTPYLRRSCGMDHELLALVEGLLEEDDARPVGGEPLSSSELLQGLDVNLGRKMGPYVLERVLGRGGMATVYGARRADGASGDEVALKLIRRGMDTDDILERFRNEREILARLEHPSIARLLDGGASEDGLPYLVMELVDGTPIDRYCDESALALDGRLRLFLRVCEAVQHAHELGVVHRDLKPSNVLVTPAGMPKLLDFGIAKVLDATSSLDTVEVTATELRLLTPEYASPEQIAGEPASTATDVHGLGIVLYELSCGRRPFRAPTARRRDLERLLLESEPEPPSSLAPVERRIPRELDTIALKALRKEPEHRYASVRELHDDVQRLRSGVPIVARATTWRYRAARLLLRNRIAVGSIALTVLGVLLGLAAVAAWLAPSPEEHVRERQTRYAALLTESALAFERRDVDAAYHVLMRTPREDRGWEWRHLLDLTDQSTSTLAGAERDFGALVLSPVDGRLLAADERGTLLVHDPITGRTREYPSALPAHTKHLELDGSGSRLAALHGTGGVTVLDTTSLQTIRSWPVPTGPGNGKCMALRHDGQVVAVGIQGPGIALRDLQGGSEEVWKTESDPIDLAFRPDGSLVQALADGSVQLLEPSTGELTGLLKLDGSSSTSSRIRIAVSLDGGLIAAANADEVRVLDVGAGRTVSSFRVARSSVRDLALSPDGVRLAVALSDASVGLYGIRDGEERGILLGHRGYLNVVAYCPDGRRIATCGDGVKLWDPQKERIVTLKGHPPTRPLLAQSPDGNLLAVTTSSEGGIDSVVAWDLDHGETLWSWPTHNNARSLVWRPDSEALVVGSTRHELVLLGASSGEILGVSAPFEGTARAACSNGDDLVATGSTEGWIRLWHWDALAPMAGRRVADVEVTALDFAPGAKHLIAGFANGEVARFTVPELERTALEDARIKRPFPVQRVVHRPDGRQFAACGPDMLIRLWSLETGGLAAVLSGHSAGVSDVTYSPDGSRLVSASPDGTLRFWDPRTGQPMAVLHPEELSGPSRVAFGCDGERLFTMDASGRVEIRRAPDPE